MDLTERKKRILRAIIESYIQSAEPVGSKAIAASIDMEVSSATIRNEMADLEAMGLLEKPHTSAGRIPSPKGYRLYVNELMEEHKLSLQETQRINQALAMRMQELDRVLDQAGRVVSQLTNYPSFALSSGLSRMTIRRFDLLMVERNAFIIVVMTDTDIVRNRLIRLPSDLTEAQLQMLNTLLNTTFTGLTLEETASVMAAPFWSTIEHMEPQEAERLTYLRKVFPSLLLTGPFSIILGFSGGLMALNDRLKLRSMVVGEKDDRVFISSEEAAIRVMEPDAENIWAPMGGEPVIVRLKEGTY